MQQRRSRAVRLTITASFAAKGFSVVCALAQVPIALRYLGTEGYGLWVTLVGLTVMLNFIDFGLGIGMQQAMAVAFGRDDHEAVRRTFFTGAAALGALALLLLALGIPLALTVNWAALLRIHDPVLRAQSHAALAVTLAACALGLPLNAVPRLAGAVQRGWIHAGWIAGGSAGTLLAVVWAAHARWSFTGFIAAATLVPVAQGIGTIVHLAWRLGWPLRAVRLLPAGELRALATASGGVALPQFGQALIQAAPAFALSLAAGPAAVTGYALLMRLYSPLLHGQTLAQAPFWPAYTEARVRGDLPWVRRAFRSSLLIAAAVGAALAVVTAYAQPLVRWWTHNATVAPATATAWIVYLWALAQVASQPLFNLLLGIGRIRALAACTVAGAAAALAGLFAAGATDARVIGGGTLGLALVGVPALAWATTRALRTGA